MFKGQKFTDEDIQNLKRLFRWKNVFDKQTVRDVTLMTAGLLFFLVIIYIPGAIDKDSHLSLPVKLLCWFDIITMVVSDIVMAYGPLTTKHSAQKQMKARRTEICSLSADESRWKIIYGEKTYYTPDINIVIAYKGIYILLFDVIYSHALFKPTADCRADFEQVLVGRGIPLVRLEREFNIGTYHRKNKEKILQRVAEKKKSSKKPPKD